MGEPLKPVITSLTFGVSGAAPEPEAQPAAAAAAAAAAFAALLLAFVAGE